MRTFFIAVVAAIVVAGGAMFLLDQSVQRQADQAFTSGTSVRLPTHGNTHNLVGKDWYAATEHGWTGDAVPTSNAPATLTN